MPNLTRVSFKRWVLLVDVQATAAAYAAFAQAGPEECGCLYCRNFAAARDQVYPKEARDFLASLGVRPNLESEVFQYCELRPGVHSYGGWLHAVGTIESGQDSSVPQAENFWHMDYEPITPQFSIGCTSNLAVVPDCFPKSGIFQIDFEAEVPWVLDEPYTGEPAKQSPSPRRMFGLSFLRRLFRT